MEDFPVVDEKVINTDLEGRMDIAQKITSMVLSLRRKVNIKVRQPLFKQIIIPAVDDTQKRYIEQVSQLIKNEVNVKEVKFVNDDSFLVKKVKCNFRVMGKKYGKLMKEVAAKMNALTQDEINSLQKNGTYSFEVSGQPVTVDAADVEIISEDIPGWLVSNDGNLTVALEVELNDELRREGMARELINRIQNIRKDSGLEITDHIKVTLSPNDKVSAAVESFGDLIKSQVLANSIVIADNNGTVANFDDFDINILIEKSK